MFTAADLIRTKRVTDYAVHGDRLIVAAQRVNEDGSAYITELIEVRGETNTVLFEGPWSCSSPAFDATGNLYFLSNRDPEDLDAKPKATARTQLWRVVAGEPSPYTDEPLGVSAFWLGGKTVVLQTKAWPDVEFHEQRAYDDQRRTCGTSALRYREMPVRSWDHFQPMTRPVFVRMHGEERVELRRGECYRDTMVSLSGDGTVLALVKAHHDHRMRHTAIELVDIASGTTLHIVEEPSPSWLTVPQLSHDGRRLAVVAGRWKAASMERERLRLYDLTLQTHSELGALVDRWFQPVAFAGDTVLATADDEALVPVFRMDSATRITGDVGSCSKVQVVGDRVWFIRSRITEPPEVFSVDLHGGTPRKESSISAAPDCPVEVTEHVAGGVPYRMVRPAGAEQPLPALLWIHGGPISAWSDVWHWRWCPLVLASQGYAVVLPNPAGSLGFGQATIDAICGNVWGGTCFEDVMAVTDAVAAMEAIDEHAMFAMGGSFGGYMTNWIGTQTQRFRALITHASVFSFEQFHATTDMPAFWANMFGLHPWSQREDLARYSPAAHVAHWRTPTLVIHGDKDYRVPITEGLALFEGLQAHGVPSELLVFPDENHWILKPPNIQVWYDAVSDWLERHLER